MYFAVDVRLYDTLIAAQGLQLVAVILAVGLVGYVLLQKKPLTHTIKLYLWALAVIWTICGCGVYAYNLHTYIHYDRPLYTGENSHEN
jgi:hypothetical protein